MASIIYKKIFEVRLLHDYLLATEENSFFSDSLTDEERKDLLIQKYTYNISNEIVLYPTPGCVEVMRNFRLRFIKTRLGFFVAQEVDQLVQPDGAILYKQQCVLDENLGLSFYLKTANGLVENYSGIPIKKLTPALFYLNNKDADNNKTYPVLSVPAQEFSADTTYEMGMLAINGGQLQQALQQTDSAAPNNWEAVDGSGFVNNGDRLLLPKRFLFKFPTIDIPVAITATLSDLNNNVVKTQNISTQGASAVLLDFCNEPLLDCVEEGWYHLKVEDANGNTIFSKKILLNDRLFRVNHLGVIDIFQNAGAGFQLADNDGFLITRVNADGSKVSHPIFEIRVRTRSTYWRYKSSEPFATDELAAAAPFMDANPDNTILTTRDPRTILAGLHRPFVAGGNPDFPNPSPGALTYGTDGRIYSDIYISTVNRFLKIN